MIERLSLVLKSADAAAMDARSPNIAVSKASPLSRMQDDPNRIGNPRWILLVNLTSNVVRRGSDVVILRSPNRSLATCLRLGFGITNLVGANRLDGPKKVVRDRLPRLLLHPILSHKESAVLCQTLQIGSCEAGRQIGQAS
jgi:hypothetical protein